MIKAHRLGADCDVPKLFYIANTFPYAYQVTRVQQEAEFQAWFCHSLVTAIMSTRPLSKFPVHSKGETRDSEHGTRKGLSRAMSKDYSSISRSSLRRSASS